MENIKVSLFASAVRPQLWPALFKSLEGMSVATEIIFAGNTNREEIQKYFLSEVDGGVEEQKGAFLASVQTMMSRLNFIYTHTENIKPSQCYEIARRNCSGEVIVWIADDCEFPNDVIGKAYNYWKSQNNEKLILSIQTKETGYDVPKGELFDMKQHCFFGHCPDTPLMAPLAMMSRKWLDELGGIDRRYVCGQYENDIVMRAYQYGGKVELFGDANCFIDIDHIGKSLAIGESKVESDFLNRPFAQGYAKDREVLENSWCRFNAAKLSKMAATGKQITKSDMFDIATKQLDTFEPYAKDISYTESESNNGKWQ